MTTIFTGTGICQNGAAMTKTFQWLVPCLLVAGGIVLTPRQSAAKAEYTKKENKPCAYCHEDGAQSGKYTPAGEYYKEHHSLTGFTPRTPDAGKAEKGKSQ